MFQLHSLLSTEFGTRINGSRIRQAVHNNQDQTQRDLGEATELQTSVLFG